MDHDTYISYEDAIEIFGERFVLMATRARIRFRRRHCTHWKRYYE